MLILSLIAGLAAAFLLFRKNPRLEGASGTAPDTAVRACVDGRPVDCYIKE